MKSIFIFIMLYFHLVNSFPNGFELFQKLSDGNFKIFLNSEGIIDLESNSSFYRIGKLNDYTLGFEGNVIDYYRSGSKYSECFLASNILTGSIKYYYESGELMAEGFYNNGKRDSIWKTYYINGNPDKVIRYTDKEYLISYRSKRGEYYVEKGFGKYKEFGGPYNKLSGRGTIENGLRVGEWKTHINTIEYYDSLGNFLKAKHVSTIMGEQSLIKYFDYTITEKFNFTLNSCRHRIFFTKPTSKSLLISSLEGYPGTTPLQTQENFLTALPKINGNENLNETLFIPLYNTLQNIVLLNKISYSRALVQFRLNTYHKVDSIIIETNNKIIERSIGDFLIQDLVWETAKNSKGQYEELMFYFVVSVIRGNIIIPEYKVNLFNNLF